MNKTNYRLNQESITYYDNKIREAEKNLIDAQKKYIKSGEKHRLMNFKYDLKKQKEIKKYRVFENRLYYDYPIEFDEYMKMVKELSDTTITLRNLGYFKGKRVSSYDEHIGSWDSQASLTSRNMRELSGGIKKSWRHVRWKNYEDEDYVRSPYVYEINGKKYLAHDISSLKKYLRSKK